MLIYKRALSVDGRHQDPESCMTLMVWSLQNQWLTWNGWLFLVVEQLLELALLEFLALSVSSPLYTLVGTTVIEAQVGVSRHRAKTCVSCLLHHLLFVNLTLKFSEVMKRLWSVVHRPIQHQALRHSAVED